MTVRNPTIQALPPEHSQDMQRAAEQAFRVLQSFSSGPVNYGSTAIQLLDEWIERLERKGPLSTAARMLVVAFLGQAFLHRHGGYWATQNQGQQETLGVVCPVAGSGNEMRFIDIVDQVNVRLAQGIVESLALFYLTTSVDLQGRL